MRITVVRGEERSFTTIRGDAIGARARVTLTTKARVARSAAGLRGRRELDGVGGMWHGSEGGGVRGEGGQRRWREKTERRESGKERRVRGEGETWAC